MTSANLRSANLWEVDLQNANLRKANLQEANLRKTKLKGANLEEADLRGVYSSLTDLQEPSSKQKHETNIKNTQGKKLCFQLWIWKDIRIKQDKKTTSKETKEINENNEINIKDQVPFDIHPQIENLIDMALLDGKFSVKEGDVILRQARNLGVDEDELEVLIDILINLHQQAESKKQAANISEEEIEISEEKIESLFLKRREEEYSNEIKECPNCGAKMENSSAFCSSCGYELAKTKNSNAVKELLDGIKSYEESYMNGETEERKRGNIMYIANHWSVGVLFLMSGGMFAEAVFNENGYIPLQKLLIFTGAAILVGVAAFLLTSAPPAKERDNFIATFPIPDTKTDLFEMIILAKSQILPVNIFQYLFTRAGKKQKQLNRVWSKKLNQIVHKDNSLIKPTTEEAQKKKVTQK